MKVLSNKTYVSLSKIKNAGRGAFASVDIKSGETVESCPFIEIPKNEIEKIEESVLLNFVYFFGDKKNRALFALGFGSIYNHSYAPNAEYKINPKENIIEFISTKDLKKDEEILVNYNQGSNIDTPLWFEVE